MRSLRPYDTLVLEGGSLRCAFTAGVMDALLLLGPMPFERILGVSAGAMVMASHLSGQYKHFYRVSKELVEDGKFIRFSSAWSKEGLMNLAHLKAYVMRHAPLDLEAIAQAQTKVHALVASATLPLVTRGKVRFREKWVFDGGYSDPIPLEKALDLGGKNILVVRTRPMGDHVSQSYVDYFASYWYRHNPALVPLFEQGHERYNATVDRLLLGGDNQGRTWEEIAPPFPLATDGWSVSSANVMADYRLGAETAMNWWAHRTNATRFRF